MKYIIFIVLIGLISCLPNKPTARINFEAPGFYPEGVVYDSLSGVFYITSARLGTVAKVNPDGVYSVLHADSNLKSSYGIKVHPDGKRLYFCSADANYSIYTSPDTRRKMSQLVILDKESGKKLSNINLAGLIPGEHFANDLCFDDQGNAYVTDSYAHAIYKVDNAGKASVFVKDPIFATKGYGVNGIVYHPNGYLLVANSNTGQLYKVDITNPKKIHKVLLDQYYMGADGILLKGKDKLIMAVNGGNEKIVQLNTEDDWQSAKMKATTILQDRFTYPSTVTRKGDELWAMNAKFHELNDSNAVPSQRFAIQKIVLKPLPRKKKLEK